MAKTIKVQHGQNLFNIACQYYGTHQGIYDIIERNNLSSPTQYLRPGRELEVTDDPFLPQSVSFLSDYVIATDDLYTRGTGIGYDSIGSTLRIGR